MHTCEKCFKKIDNNNLYKTKCKHYFHHTCMFDWLQHSNNCPTCNKCIKKKFNVEVNNINNTLILKKNHILFMNEKQKIYLNNIKRVFRNGENYIYLYYKNINNVLIKIIINGEAYRIFDLLCFKINRFNQTIMLNKNIENNSIYE